MFYRAASNQYIVEQTPFTIDGTGYPADWLGVDDGSSLIDWQYCQRSGGPKVYKVEIEVIG